MITGYMGVLATDLVSIEFKSLAYRHHWSCSQESEENKIFSTLNWRSNEIKKEIDHDHEIMS